MPNILWETDLGIVGLVITCLITLIAYIIRSGNLREDLRVTASNNYYENLQQAHNKERREWRIDATARLDIHKEERDITRSESMERQDATTLVLNELKEAIKENNNLHKGASDG